MRCKPCSACGLITRVVFLALLVALVPTAYLVYEYYLKSWGRDRIKDYATAAINAAASLNASQPDLSGALVDGVACIKCIGVNNVYPVTSKSHPTYGSFQVTLINDGGWVTSMFLIIGVAIGAGGSLLVALLNTVQGVSSTATASQKPTSSTAQNGCGIFEMVLMISQAQFITLLGSLQLEGTPLFFLEFAKKLAWTNMQIFPSETSFDPTQDEIVTGASRRLALSAASSNATGVERYSLLIGSKPSHFFYYTCAALAVALGSILFVYLFLRVVIGSRNRKAAASLDHRVIWVFLLFLLLAQYIISMASCFQIYYTLSNSSRSTAEITLAIVILAAACIGLLIFGIIKIARHRDEVDTHGTPQHDPNKWFHLRYSAFYQDYNVPNIYFFVAKMVLDIASGAIIGTIQDAPLQIGILVAFNVIFLMLLIWRQPYLVPLFYYVAVFAGYLRVVLLLLTLVQSRPDVFAQDVRDYVAVLIIGLNALLLICILIRQFYVLSIAIYRWASRPKHQPIPDEELGIPLQPMGEPSSDASDVKSLSRTSNDLVTNHSVSSHTSTRLSTSKSRPSHNSMSQPISDSTLFASQPYHEMGDEAPAPRSKRERHSTPGYASDSSAGRSTKSTPTKGGGRRSLYTQRRRKHRELMATKNEELPDWAQV